MRGFTVFCRFYHVKVSPLGFEHVLIEFAFQLTGLEYSIFKVLVNFGAIVHAHNEKEEWLLGRTSTMFKYRDLTTLAVS